MDETAGNKQVVAEFFARAEAEEDIFPLLADDVLWVVPGEWQLSGTYPKAKLAGLFGLVLDDLAYPPRFTIHSVTAEGDRVAVQAESQSRFNDGEPFGNSYHFLFFLHGGLIVKVIECMDTHYMSNLIQRRTRSGT